MEDQIERRAIADVLDVPAFALIREDEHWSNGPNVPPYRQDQRYDKVRDR